MKTPGKLFEISTNCHDIEIKVMSAKTVIVTGASRGIGLAIAEHLLRSSHNVVAVARSKAPLEELKSRYPQQVQFITGDLAQFKLAQETVDLTLKNFGKIDGLIINHGVLDPVAKVGDAEPEAWKEGFDINFFSAIAFVKAALPALRKSKGRILFTSSGASVSAYHGWGAYGASKAALNHLALTLSVEEPDVTSISIRPGVVDTEMQKELREKHSETMQETDVAKFCTLHRDGKLLRPDQPGNVMAKLVLNGSNTLSGKFLGWDSKELADFQGP